MSTRDPNMIIPQVTASDVAARLEVADDSACDEAGDLHEAEASTVTIFHDDSVLLVL
jgi:hypothetical protein